MNDFKISKFMSYVLRHDTKGMPITNEGWMDLNDLLTLINERFSYKVELEDVKRIVSENNKQRFKIDGNNIRASQGHSNKYITLNLSPKIPPDYLYHGTKRSILVQIKKEGVKKMSRHHVHLSSDRRTAEIVAKRWNEEILILIIDAKMMHREGYSFYLSDNGVWLTDSVFPRYISFL